MNVKLNELASFIDSEPNKLWLVVSMIPGCITKPPATADNIELNMFGVLIALIYDLFKQMNRSMETIIPIIAHHATNLEKYAEALELALDKYCNDKSGETLLPTAFIEILDNRTVYFNWVNRSDIGTVEGWAPYDMKPRENCSAQPLPPVTSLTISVSALYLRTLGAKLHEKAFKAFSSGVLFKRKQ